MPLSARKTTFLTGLNDVHTVDKEGVGTIRIEGPKAYKYVKHDGVATVAVGDFLCYADAVDLTSVQAANAAVGAGVSMFVSAIGTVRFGWIQVRGVATLLGAIAGAGPAAGMQVTNAGAAAKVVTQRAAVTDPVVGRIVHVANKLVDLLDLG